MIIWDIKLGDPVDFFDPAKSYELTRYRPITETQGLDFDPKPFTEVGDFKLQTGRYTTFPYNSKLHRDFWIEQHRRSQEGYEVNGYRITGDHYFFLNFYQLQLVQDVVVTGSGRTTQFPSFMLLQYEYFHYIELLESSKLDVLTLKSRGVGWSEILALMGSSRYTTTSKYISIYTAFYEDYLLGTGGVVTKCWDNLEYLNTETEGGMRRLRQSVNTTNRKRLSVLDKDKTERGHMLEISLIITDKPRKLRGTRVDRLFFEEIGSNEHSIKLWIQSLALVSVQGNKFGTRLGWGCLCAGQKVWNNKGELVNIEDLNKQDGIIGFNNTTGIISKEEITYWQPPTNKECYKITTNTGRTLECSLDHPILTLGVKAYPKKERLLKYRKNVIEREPRTQKYTTRFIETQHLKINDRIGIAEEVLIFGELIMLKPRFIGWLIGDGSYGFDKTPVLSNCEPEINDYIDINFHTTVEKSYVTKTNKLYKETRIRNICSMLRRLGIYGQTKLNKTLPINTHQYNKETLLELLGGLFDTDGYVGKNQLEISITSLSETLLNEIRFLLQKFGIHGRMQLIKKNINNPRSKNDYYTFFIKDKDSIINFADNIKLFPKEKQERLIYWRDILLLKKANHTKDISGVRFERIIDLQYIGLKPVYNLTAGITHTYLGNGIITHNTGGDQGPQLLGLEKMFFNPTDYNILPYKHNCTKNGEYVVSLYFVPLYLCLAGFIDSRGVTKIKEAKEHFVKERNKLITNLEDYLINCLEYCFTPEELLSRQGVNSFNQLKLAEQRLNIELHKRTNEDTALPEIERGFLEWIYNGNDEITGVKWNKDQRGNILVLEKPIKDAEGQTLKNLYVAGVDSIDQGVADSVVGEKGSKFCITVKKRAFGNGGNQYVCMYLDRPPTAKEAYAIALKILWWYGCKANLEDTKITFRLYLRERKWDNKMLMKRPQFGLQDPAILRFKKNTSELWGTPGSTKMIDHGLELITDYIEDNCHKIFFIDMIDQLQRYSYENKGVFDIVSSMIMTEIGDEDMFNTKVKDMVTEKKVHKDIGYYYDSDGIKHWGVIPGATNSTIKVCVPQIWRVN